MQMRSIAGGLSVAWALLGLAAPAPALEIDWVAVGGPGNAADDTGFGAVGYPYAISATEVTNAHYAGFLNAVAASDPNGLYSTSMGGSGGGIARSGSNGTYAYAPNAARADHPVAHVSFHDALRFANWLHHGQPSGPQGPATTEDGAYTISAQGVADNTIARNAGAKFALASEDEWYKAAYYDAAAGRYFDYPNGSDAPIACGAAPGGPNDANCNQQGGGPSSARSYAATSPAGTWDQGGNAWEWVETVHSGSDRGFRGGWYGGSASALNVYNHYGIAPSVENPAVGFRVTSLPEPGPGVVLALGAWALARSRRRVA